MHPQAAYAFLQLNRRLRPGLMAYFLRRLGNHAEAESMTNEVLMRLAGTGPARMQAAEAYIFRMAANLLRDRSRREKARFGCPSDALVADDVGVDVADPSRVGSARESLASVTTALRELSERERMIFILYRLENVDKGDIAEVFEFSLGTLEPTLRRVLAHVTRRVTGSEGGTRSKGMTVRSDDLSQSDALEQASAWCFRLAEDRLTPQTRAAFEGWLLADPGHVAALGDVVHAWQALDQTHLSPEMIAMRRCSLATFRQGHALQWARNGRRRLWLWLRALAVCLAVLVAGAWLHMAERYQTVVDERKVIVLADGSKLPLDVRSRADVRLSNDRRERLAPVRLFNDEPLHQAVERVNRYSPRPFVLDDPTIAGGIRNSVAFLAGDADAFIEGIASGSPVRVESAARHHALRSVQ